MTAREREFRRRKITFRPDEHEDIGRKMSMFARVIGQDLFQMLRVGLGRADEELVLLESTASDRIAAWLLSP